jgi:glycosyltransferase involved in cell wall biosynthesis/SAM-dependent methyltransferase
LVAATEHVPVRNEYIPNLVAGVKRQTHDDVIIERTDACEALRPLLAQREAMLSSISWHMTRRLRAVVHIFGRDFACRHRAVEKEGCLTRMFPHSAQQAPSMPEPIGHQSIPPDQTQDPSQPPPTSRPSPRRLLRIARGLLTGDPAYRERLRELMSPVLGPLQKQVHRLASATWSIGAERVDVVYVSGESHTPGHYYRVERYADAARAAGLRIRIVRFSDWEGHTRDLSGARIVVIWRLAMSAKVASIIRAARAEGAQLIFDVDDLMFVPELARVSIIDGIRTQGLAEQTVADFYLEVRKVLTSSDLCTTTTDELARYAQQAGRPTLVLPNGYDDNTFIVSRTAARRWARQRTDHLLRIGYAGGSRTHQRDFDLCAGAVATVLRERDDVRLVLFHSSAAGQPLVDLDEFPVFHGLEDRVEWRELVPLERLPDEVARFDVNLAPLEVGNPFCEAKSELKFFEAALAGVCTVASPTGPFRRAIRNGETGFLAQTQDEWLRALSSLLNDKALRERMAKTALHEVLWSFGPDRRAQSMATVLQLLRGGREAALAFERELQADQQSQPAEVPYHRTLFCSDRYGPAEVTVIVPLHNYADVVEEALESVRQQTLTYIDLIVIDDASNDDSAAVATRWAKRHAARFNRLLILQNCANAGLGYTRNVGFAEADTLYVLPLDADNRLLPHCAERCLETIRAHRAAFAYPVIRQYGDVADIVGKRRYDPLTLTFGNYIDAMALISKPAWTLVGGYEHVRFGWEDYDFWCKLAERGLYGVPVGGEPLAEYRVHSSSMLRTMTETEENKRRLVDDMHERHRWLRLDYTVIQSSGAQAAKPPGDVKSVVGTGRLPKFLPMLRCPETGLPLRLENDTLVNADGSRRWPIIQGRALLFSGMRNPAVQDESHISNPLPAHVVQRIRNTPGMVLNLSAGGTQERLPNVVEVEAAIFRHTDVVADSHHLPFTDAMFEGVVSLNAFEHYAEPLRAAAEIRRVLKPGGWLLLHTAFLQPEHEAPWHFYNCTREGLARWFAEFDIELIHVSDNLNPVYALSWLASECESALAEDVSEIASEQFQGAAVRDLVKSWREPSARDNDLWKNFKRISQQRQQGIAAGFELIARRPYD